MLGASGVRSSRGAGMPWVTPFPTVPEHAPDGDSTDEESQRSGSTPTDGAPVPGTTTSIRETPVVDRRGASGPTGSNGPGPGRNGSVSGAPGSRTARPDAAGRSDRGRTSTPPWLQGPDDPTLTRAARSARSLIMVPATLAAGLPLLGALVALGIVISDESLLLFALLAVIVGLGGGVWGATVTLRRLRSDIDEPVVELREVALRLAAGEPADRVSAPTVGPLVPVAVALETAGTNVSATTDRLVSEARWGSESRQILDALDLARTEREVYQVVSRALELVDDEHPSELLMAPANSSHELAEVAVNAAAGSPGCSVAQSDDCLSIRRGQVVITDSSEAINACPHLRGRPGGPCSAVCVPVAVEGHSAGVIHASGQDRYPPGPQVVDRLSDLSRQVGARLGALRALESSRAEASTDGLTGLANRRSLETALDKMLEGGRSFVAVLGDLDKFKSLNDSFGHEAGDRALQLFARVMQENVRGHDMVARVGGEEFVVVYPDMSVQGSIEAIERLRTALASAVAVASVQPFTCSFGVTHSSVGHSVAEILRVADAGLLRAKELGGDKVVYADQALAAEMFDPGDGGGPVPPR